MFAAGSCTFLGNLSWYLRSHHRMKAYLPLEVVDVKVVAKPTAGSAPGDADSSSGSSGLLVKCLKMGRCGLVFVRLGRQEPLFGL
jgi:hypothetical protein